MVKTSKMCECGHSFWLHYSDTLSCYEHNCKCVKYEKKVGNKMMKEESFDEFAKKFPSLKDNPCWGFCGEGMDFQDIMVGCLDKQGVKEAIEEVRIKLGSEHNGMRLFATCLKDKLRLGLNERNKI